MEDIQAKLIIDNVQYLASLFFLNINYFIQTNTHPFNEKELLEALKLLEEEDYIILHGNRKRPLIKLGGALK